MTLWRIRRRGGWLCRLLRRYFHDAKVSPARIKCNCSCNSLFTSFLSHQVSVFTHLHSVHFSVLSMNYRKRKTLQRVSVVCYITDDSWRKCRLLDHGYNAVAMTLGPAAMLCPGFCTGSWQKRSKRVKYCGSIHTPRPSPDEGGDVCKVWLRSVQKCGFV